uniref:Replicase n=1 Tax=Podosphaera prunicola tobamo-like virus TaxID=2052571 RepID=A0A2P9JAM9_9VIRU|nr:replicase [Podosphaera prunicola tobamo-like virus]
MANPTTEDWINTSLRAVANNPDGALAVLATEPFRNMACREDHYNKSRIKVKINAYLTVKERSFIQDELYPHLNIDFMCNTFSSHGLAAARRAIEQECILRRCKKYETIVDVGGNFASHLKLGRNNIHCCSPLINMWDAKRNTERKLECEKWCERAICDHAMQINPDNRSAIAIKAARAREFSTNRTKFYCNNRAESCPLEANTVMFGDSLYDIPFTIVGTILEQKGASIAYANLTFDPEILVSDSGYISGMDCCWKRFNRDVIVADKWLGERVERRDMISFYFKDSSSKVYEHDYNNYLRLVTAQVFYGPKGAKFVVERELNHGMMTMTFTHVEFCEEETVLSFNYWFTNTRNKVLVNLYDYNGLGGGFKNLDITCTQALVDRDLVEAVISYGYRLADDKFTPETMFSYCVSKNARATVNGVDLTVTKSESSPICYKLCFTLWFVCFMAKFERVNLMDYFVGREIHSRKLRTANWFKVLALVLLDTGGKSLHDFMFGTGAMSSWFSSKRTELVKQYKKYSELPDPGYAIPEPLVNFEEHVASVAGSVTPPKTDNVVYQKLIDTFRSEYNVKQLQLTLNIIADRLRVGNVPSRDYDALNVVYIEGLRRLAVLDPERFADMEEPWSATEDAKRILDQYNPFVGTQGKTRNSFHDLVSPTPSDSASNTIDKEVVTKTQIDVAVTKTDLELFEKTYSDSISLINVEYADGLCAVRVLCKALLKINSKWTFAKVLNGLIRETNNERENWFTSVDIASFLDTINLGLGIIADSPDSTTLFVVRRSSNMIWLYHDVNHWFLISEGSSTKVKFSLVDKVDARILVGGGILPDTEVVFPDNYVREKFTSQFSGFFLEPTSGKEGLCGVYAIRSILKKKRKFVSHSKLLNMCIEASNNDRTSWFEISDLMLVMDKFGFTLGLLNHKNDEPIEANRWFATLCETREDYPVVWIANTGCHWQPVVSCKDGFYKILVDPVLYDTLFTYAEEPAEVLKTPIDEDSCMGDDDVFINLGISFDNDTSRNKDESLDVTSSVSYPLVESSDENFLSRESKIKVNIPKPPIDFKNKPVYKRKFERLNEKFSYAPKAKGEPIRPTICNSDSRHVVSLIQEDLTAVWIKHQSTHDKQKRKWCCKLISFLKFRRCLRLRLDTQKFLKIFPNSGRFIARTVSKPFVLIAKSIKWFFRKIFAGLKILFRSFLKTSKFIGKWGWKLIKVLVFPFKLLLKGLYRIRSIVYVTAFSFLPALFVWMTKKGVFKTVFFACTKFVCYLGKCIFVLATVHNGAGLFLVIIPWCVVSFYLIARFVAPYCVERVFCKINGCFRRELKPIKDTFNGIDHSLLRQDRQSPLKDEVLFKGQTFSVKAVTDDFTTCLDPEEAEIAFVGKMRKKVLNGEIIRPSTIPSSEPAASRPTKVVENDKFKDSEKPSKGYAALKESDKTRIKSDRAALLKSYVDYLTKSVSNYTAHCEYVAINEKKFGDSLFSKRWTKHENSSNARIFNCVTPGVFSLPSFMIESGEKRLTCVYAFKKSYGTDGVLALCENKEKLLYVEGNPKRIMVMSGMLEYLDMFTLDAVNRHVNNLDVEPCRKFILAQGVPGCGKSHSIASQVQDGDLIAVASRAATDEMQQKLIAFGKNPKLARTVGSRIIGRIEPAQRLFIDEGLKLHPGELVLLGEITGAKEIIVAGDEQQLGFSPRVPGYTMPVESIHWSKSYTTMSRTVAKDVVVALGRMVPKGDGPILDGRGYYPEGFTTLNPVERSLFVENINNEGDVKKVKGAKYLTWTQSAKKKLLNSGFENVNTVDEFQGGRAKHVILVRLEKNLDINCRTSTGNMIVALTRHTERLDYATVDQPSNLSDLTLRTIKRVYAIKNVNTAYGSYSGDVSIQA